VGRAEELPVHGAVAGGAVVPAVSRGPGVQGGRHPRRDQRDVRRGAVAGGGAGDGAAAGGDVRDSVDVRTGVHRAGDAADL